MLIIDAHEDLAWNMLTFGRDYSRAAAETRRLEVGSDTPQRNDDCLLGWPDFRRGRVAMVFATLFAEPMRAVTDPKATQVYVEPRQANLVLRRQMDAYERLSDERPNHFRLVRGQRDLDEVVQAWNQVDEAEKEKPVPPTINQKEKKEFERENAASEREIKNREQEEPQGPVGPPVGVVVSIEGADGILEPGEVEAWWERGVRLVGPAWHGTAYSGGTKEPGPLSRLGFELLERMALLKMGLDLTHMDETAALQALDAYPGTLLASHSNAHALIKDDSNRHLSDRTIAGIVERDGVIGIVPFIAFLRGGWKRGERRNLGSLAQVVAQIDYICQMAGDARHVGFGTDFDGGFGLQSVPPGINSIADLHLLAPLLAEKGYTEEDQAAIFGGNWLDLLKRILPESL